MSDFLTKDQRSKLMARIRDRNTAPERYVRRVVWTAGFRYRLNVRTLPGKPDLVLARYRTVVFVQGCFWHGHSCRKGERLPKTNVAFWSAKIATNVKRDSVNISKLEASGWTVCLIWECNLSEDTDALLVHLNRLRSGILSNATSDGNQSH